MIRTLAFLLFLSSITKMTYADCKQDIQTCQTEAGISDTMSGQGTTDMAAACSNGAMNKLVTCMTNVLTRCGMSSLYDIPSMQNAIKTICANAQVFDDNKACISGKANSFTNCGNSMAMGLEAYVQKHGANDPMAIACSAVGGVKSCMRGSYTSCSQAVADSMVQLMDSFSPKACKSYTSCSICDAGSLAKGSFLLLAVILFLQRAL